MRIMLNTFAYKVSLGSIACVAPYVQVPMRDKSFEGIADYQDTLMTQLLHVILV